MAAQAEPCAVCLRSLRRATVGLCACGHFYHARCLLGSLQGKILASWSCPLCRAATKGAGIVPACTLPPEVRGRHFVPPEQLALPPPIPQGPLLAVHDFMAAAQQALQEEHPATANESSSGSSSSHGVGPTSLLRLADAMLPAPASQAAATVLASLAAQQLLQPGARSPAALLALVGGSLGFGLVLLAAFMGGGLVALCHASAAAGALFGAPAHDCIITESSPHQLALQLVVIVETAGVWAVLALTFFERHGSGGGATKLLLHMQGLAGPALAFLLLRLLLAALLVGATVLLLAFTVVLLLSLLAWLPGALIS